MDTDKICAESIAKQYAPKSASKLTALKKLDAKAKRPANIFAYSFGIASSLLLGVGMCLTMGMLGPGEGHVVCARNRPWYLGYRRRKREPCPVSPDSGNL